MSDDQIRRAERQLKASGASLHELTWIRERLRAGDLERLDVVLAANLGHAASSELLGLDWRAREAEVPEWEAIETRLDRCADVSRDGVHWRLTLAGCRHLIAAAWNEETWGPGPGQLLAAVERWVLTAGGEAERADLNSAFLEACTGGDYAVPSPEQPLWPIWLPEGFLNRDLARLRATCGKGVYAAAAIHRVASHALREGDEVAYLSGLPVEYGQKISKAAAARRAYLDAVRDEVCPWVLGLSEPEGQAER